MNSTHKFTWLLMVVTILTITNCKGRSQSMSAVGEPLDTASMMLDTASMMKVTREGLSPTEQMNTFALQLFLRLHKTKQGVQNFVVSPLSVATLISIITHGAEGETLHFPN